MPGYLAQVTGHSHYSWTCCRTLSCPGPNRKVALFCVTQSGDQSRSQGWNMLHLGLKKACQALGFLFLWQKLRNEKVVLYLGKMWRAPEYLWAFSLPKCQSIFLIHSDNGILSIEWTSATFYGMFIWLILWQLKGGELTQHWNKIVNTTLQSK